MTSAPPAASGAAATDATLSRRIVLTSWVGTSVFAVVAIAALVADAIEPVTLAVDIALFGVGTAVFLWALAVAAARSRSVEMGIGGLFFLAGATAPPTIKRQLLGALVAQVVIGLATASAKPFTELAGGVLVPMFGLALCGLWGAKLGTFRARGDAGGR